MLPCKYDKYHIRKKLHATENELNRSCRMSTTLRSLVGAEEGKRRARGHTEVKK
jgi:hypothetical protein